MLKKQTKNKFEQLDNMSTNEKFVKGTAWLSTGLIISRLIGALYIIFWARWIGEHYELANGLYALAYTPYALFLDLASAGFPLAITKQISQFNAKNDYKASLKLFKSSLIIMIAFGLIAASIFFIFSEAILASSIQPTGKMSDNVYVLRSLIPALVIIPPMSLIRGFFQGFQKMNTPAISQIIEQVFRVGYMLFMTYYIMQVTKGSFIDAVVHSTFAAFIGALASLVFLGFEFIRSWPYIKTKIASGIQTTNITFQDSIKTVLHDSLPFIVMSAGTGLLAYADQVMYRPIMSKVSDFTQQQMAITYAWFSANATKLISIIGALNGAVSAATIANIASVYHTDRKRVSDAINHSLKLFTFILMPAAIGIFVIANSFYRVFYGDANGADVLRTASLYLITASFYGVFVSMIQGMGKHKIALRSLALLLLSKITFNLLFMGLFKEQGSNLAAIGSGLLASIYLWDELYKQTKFNTRRFINDLRLILQSTIAMAVVTTIIHTLLSHLLPEFGMIPNLIKVLVSTAFGGVTYIIVATRLNIAHDLFPSLHNRLKNFLKI